MIAIAERRFPGINGEKDVKIEWLLNHSHRLQANIILFSPANVEGRCVPSHCVMGRKGTSILTL